MIVLAAVGLSATSVSAQSIGVSATVLPAISAPAGTAGIEFRMRDGVLQMSAPEATVGSVLLQAEFKSVRAVPAAPATVRGVTAPAVVPAALDRGDAPQGSAASGTVKRVNGAQAEPVEVTWVMAVNA
jgi:hypothetical protein